METITSSIPYSVLLRIDIPCILLFQSGMRIARILPKECTLYDSPSPQFPAKEIPKSLRKAKIFLLLVYRSLQHKVQS